MSFFQVVNNLIFASSERFLPTLGGVAPYDAACNRLATKVGINNPTDNGYIAAISDSRSLFMDRLRPGVRGWSRMDGKPFTDDIRNAFADGLVYHPIFYDEQLEEIDQGFSWENYALTGMDRNGALGDTCSDWTGEGVRYGAGLPATGDARSWIGVIGNTCDAETGARVICLGNTQTVPLLSSPEAGKRIWISNTALDIGGSMTPDQKCNSEKPPGVALAAALIAYTTRSASEVIDPEARYVRLDGQLMGTGAQLIGVSEDLTANSHIETSIWQAPDGTYDNSDRPWTGSQGILTRGTRDTTCRDWTDASLTAILGSLDSTLRDFWFNPLPSDCVLGRRIYCVEL